MLINDNEIDFQRLSAARFEELCFDLLLELGYRRLNWRQGGADNGRDIEGIRVIENGLVEPYSEKWFFECKNHKAGVGVTHIDSKVSWAEAEKVDHLVLLIGSYLTNDTKLWLERITPTKNFIIHILEGKQLKSRILQHRSLVEKYFSSELTQLLQTLMKSWLVHDLIPDAKAIAYLGDKLDPCQMTPSELAFFCASIRSINYDLDEMVGETVVPYQFGKFFSELVRHKNTDLAVLPTDGYIVHEFIDSFSDWNSVYPEYIIARIEPITFGRSDRALYVLNYDSEGEGLEFLIESNSEFPVSIRYFPHSAHEAAISIAKNLSNNNTSHIKGTIDYGK